MKSSLSNLPKFDRKKAYMLLSTLWVITKDSWNRRMSCFLRHSVVEPTTTTTFLCFELEQIRGHFTSWGPPLFVGRSGLGFAPTQSIAEIQHSWDIFNYCVTVVISRLCFELEQIRDHFAQQIWGVLRTEVVRDLLEVRAYLKYYSNSAIGSL